jgi:cephalosporin hydroxylase
LSFDEVHARLEESDQTLLAQAVLAEDAQTSHEEVLAAIREYAPHGRAAEAVAVEGAHP